MDLQKLGWKQYFNDNFLKMKTAGQLPARIATAQREIYSAFCESGEYRAEISGKMRFNAMAMGDLPVVGDWVAARMSPDGNLLIIENILPRFNKFSRKTPGNITDEQVLVANIDIAFLVNGLDSNYNLRRIERYLTIAYDNNIKPVIILNKSDICDNVQEKIREVESISMGAPVHVLSALNNSGVEFLHDYIKDGTATAFLGSSGVGKSTLINCLLGEDRLKTGAVRQWDDKGKHVTTSRELLLLPGGGIVIDNPGLRELQLWVDEKSINNTFHDIEELASQCKFTDCTHSGEPGCAVARAIESNQLDSKRFRNYLKLRKEHDYLSTRKEIKSRNKKIIWEKNISKLSKKIMQHKKKYE